MCSQFVWLLFDYANFLSQFPIKKNGVNLFQSVDLDCSRSSCCMERMEAPGQGYFVRKR